MKERSGYNWEDILSTRSAKRAKMFIQSAFERKPDRIMPFDAKEANSMLAYAIKQASKSPNSVGEHIHLGLLLTYVGYYRRAVEAFDQVIELDPDYADAHSYRGTAFFELGCDSAALAAFERAIRASHGSNAAYFNLALALALLDRTPDAKERLQSMLSNKPRDTALLFLQCDIRRAMEIRGW